MPHSGAQPADRADADGSPGPHPGLGRGQDDLRQLLAALPSGSFFLHYDGTYEVQGEALQAQKEYDDTGAVPYVLREPAQLAELYAGLELVEPGQVSA